MSAADLVELVGLIIAVAAVMAACTFIINYDPEPRRRKAALKRLRVRR